MSIILEKSNTNHNISATIIIIFIITMATMFINFFVDPDRFADYYSYIELTDKYYYLRDEDWFLFEPISTSLFIALKYIFVSTEISVNVAHYLLGAIYLIFISYLSLKFKADWRSVLICFCVFGPFMAFITIRATPAYFLVVLGFIESLRGKTKAFLYIFVAALFHMSAILALVPLALSLLQNRSATFSWIYAAGKRSFLMVLFISLLIGTLQLFFQELIYNAVNSIPIMSRYLVYVYSAYSDTAAAGGSSTESSIFHTVYLAFCTIFVGILISSSNDVCKKSRLYIISSYAVFILLQFSPVTAFRQSVFWMVPAIFIFPWSAYTLHRLGAFPLFITALAVFIYQMSALFV